MPTQTSTSTTDRIARDDLALTLRRGGFTYRQIAVDLGLSDPARAHEAAQRAAIRQYGTDDVIRQPGRARRPRPVVRHLLQRRFGIEIEFNRGQMHYRGDTNAVAAALVRAGLQAEAESYNHSTRSHWKVTTDATVSGCEVVSPVLNGGRWDEVERTMRAVRELGAEVGTNCGMHVHHDATDFDGEGLAALLDNLQMAQYALAAYVTRSRYNGSNGYAAAMISDYEWELLHADLQAGRLFAANNRRRMMADGFVCRVQRYKFFNFQPLGMYGTVEFRGHGGTLNAKKARAWVAVGQAVMEFSRLGKTFTVPAEQRRVTVTEMLDQLVAEGLLSQDMAARFTRRAVALYGEARLSRRGGY